MQLFLAEISGKPGATQSVGEACELGLIAQVTRGEIFRGRQLESMTDGDD